MSSLCEATIRRHTMFTELYEIIRPLIYLIGALFYCVFLQFLARWEYRYKNKKNSFPDEVGLKKLAQIYGISEYVLFCAAADKWHISEKQREAAFKAYLKYGEIPHYVRDLVRHHKKEIDTHHTMVVPLL
jgi:hypothetical protein